MINLTEKDKEIIRHLGFPKSNKLSMGDFYIKCVSKAAALKELFGEQVSREIFHMKCPKEYIAVVDSEYYILSEDLNLEGQFITAEHLGVKGNMSLYDIWTLLEKEHGNVEEDMMDILKIYMFDVLFHNLDRKEDNWGFLYLPNNVRKVVILDYDLILSNNPDDKEGAEKNLEVHAKLDEKLSIYDDFKVFLLESDKEFLTSFKTYFDLLTPEYCKVLMEKIARENNIPTEPECDFIPPFIDTLTNLYKCHYEKIRRIYESVIERRDSVAR